MPVALLRMLTWNNGTNLKIVLVSRSEFPSQGKIMGEPVEIRRGSRSKKALNLLKFMV